MIPFSYRIHNPITHYLPSSHELPSLQPFPFPSWNRALSSSPFSPSPSQTKLLPNETTPSPYDPTCGPQTSGLECVHTGHARTCDPLQSCRKAEARLVRDSIWKDNHAPQAAPHSTDLPCRDAPSSYTGTVVQHRE